MANNPQIEIYADLELKTEDDPTIALETIELLERVHQGEEPDEVMNDADVIDKIGEPVEVLLKSYKWIWGQEDVNYPTGEGRNMSMKGILELKSLIQDRLRKE